MPIIGILEEIPINEDEIKEANQDKTHNILKYIGIFNLDTQSSIFIPLQNFI